MSATSMLPLWRRLATNQIAPKFDGDHVVFTAGAALPDATAYSFGRNAASQLQLNVPTGGGFLMTVNAVNFLQIATGGTGTALTVTPAARTDTGATAEFVTDFQTTVTPGGASATTISGFRSLIQTSAALAVTTQELVAVLGRVIHQGTTTLARAEGLMSLVSNTSTGTISEAVGHHIAVPINSGGGAITVTIGIDIDDLTVGGTRYGILYRGTGPTNAVVWGTDAAQVRFYRNADGTARLVRGSGGSFGFEFVADTSGPQIIRSFNSTGLVAQMTLQNTTISGGTLNAVMISPTFSAESFQHNALQINATSNGTNGATPGLVGLEINLTKGTGATTLDFSEGLRFGTPAVAGTIGTHRAIHFLNQSGVGVTTSICIDIDAQSGGTTMRAMRFVGTGIVNSLELGDTAVLFSNAAENIRIMESTGVRGIDFNLSLGNQNIESIIGGLDISSQTEVVRIMDASLTRGVSFTLTVAGDQTLGSTAGNLIIAVAGTNEITITPTNFQPATNDGIALGISGTAFSDAFFASGAVIDFNAGDVVWTHSANLITQTGGGFTVSFAGLPFTSQNLTDGASVEVARLQGPARAVPADNDEIFLSFYQGQTGGGTDETGRITIVQTDEAAGTNDSYMAFSSNRGSTLTELFRLGSTAIATTTVQVNPTNIDCDFLVHGDNTNNLLQVDASNDNINFGSEFLEAGTFISISPAARSIVANFAYLNVDNTALITITTGFADYRCVQLDAPNLSIAAAQTVARATTLYIAGAPTNAGAGAITDPYAFWSDSGTNRFDGNIIPSTSEILTLRDTTEARGINLTFTAAGDQTIAPTAGNLIIEAGAAELIQLSTSSTKTSTHVRILATTTTQIGNSLLVGNVDDTTASTQQMIISIRMNRVAVAPTGDMSFMDIQPIGTIGTAGASTVTNLSVFRINDFTYGGGLTVTRASLLRFTAAVGTHKLLPAAVDASGGAANGALTIRKLTAEATGRSVTIIAYMAVDINGTLGYVPVFDANP